MRARSATCGLLLALAAVAVSGEGLADPPGLPPSPTTPPADQGIVLGASVIYLAPGFPHNDTGEWGAAPTLGGGPAFGATAGYRWHGLVVGLSYQHASLGTGGTWSVKTTDVRTLSATSDLFCVDLVDITAQDAPFAAYFHVALGLRAVHASTDDPYDSSGRVTNVSYQNGDVFFGLGVEVRVYAFRMVPEVGIGAGPIGLYSQIGMTTYFDFTRGLWQEPPPAMRPSEPDSPRY
jgi:hypothetical protein